MFDREDNREERAESGFGVGLPGLNRQPYITWFLIVANLAVWLLSQVMSVQLEAGDGWNVVSFPATLLAQIVGNSTSSAALVELGAMRALQIAGGEYWRLFTAMFLHFGWVHLAVNCFGLYIFGQMIEDMYGRGRFVVIYVLAGLAGGVASYAFNLSHALQYTGVGASGAVLGLLGAMTAFFVRNREMLGGMGSRTIIGLLLVAGINLAFGFIIPGVDNFAHVGGFAGGVALGLAFAPAYTVATNYFGFQAIAVDDNSLRKRWWAIPIAVAILVAGVWIGNGNVPYP